MQSEMKLMEILRGFGSAAVAFSGGVDSAVLAKAASLALGDRAVAITAWSELLPKEELEEAKQIAAAIGILHVVVEMPDLENPKFVENDKERCYYCKKARFDALAAWAKAAGYSKVLEGSNLDDYGDYRPGMRAVEENIEIASPLIEAGFHKDGIRALAKEWNIAVWNKPSAACLASRLSYGLTITAARLKQVERAERIVKKYAAGQLRVRHHGDLARIEADAAAVKLLTRPEIRAEIVTALKGLGFVYVVLDLQGYRMGSQNEAIGKN